MGMNPIPLELDVQMFLCLLIAVVLGALVGYERERAGKPAGVRTHGMVSLGAALFAVVSIHGFGGTGDPARIAAQIVTGIGFLGAGAILHQRQESILSSIMSRLMIITSVHLQRCEQEKTQIMRPVRNYKDFLLIEIPVDLAQPDFRPSRRFFYRKSNRRAVHNFLPVPAVKDDKDFALSGKEIL